MARAEMAVVGDSLMVFDFDDDTHDDVIHTYLNRCTQYYMHIGVRRV